MNGLLAYNTLANTLSIAVAAPTLIQQQEGRNPGRYGYEGGFIPPPMPTTPQQEPSKIERDFREFFGGFGPNPSKNSGGSGVGFIGPDGKIMNPESIRGGSPVDQFITQWGFNIVLVLLIAGSLYAMQRD